MIEEIYNPKTGLLPRFIGLCGDIGSGKDTVADILVDRYGYTRLSWAGPLKEVCLLIYGPLGAERRHFFGTQADKDEPIPGIVDASGEPRTGRMIMEHLGTEGFRFIDQGTWVKHAMATLDWHQRWVVPDVRFANEFSALRTRSGVIWEVVKVGGPDHGKRDHSSDNEWRELPKDAIVAARYGDLAALRQSVGDMLFNGSAAHQSLLSG